MVKLNKTRYFGLNLPEYDDPIDIGSAFNDAMDTLDNRIGSLTEQGWVSDTAISVSGFTASSAERRTKRFNKTVIEKYRFVVSFASSIFEIIVDTGQLQGEPEYQAFGEASLGPADYLGSGILKDISTGLNWGVIVTPSLASSNRLALRHTSGDVTNTQPFPWAAGDIIDFTIIRQTGEVP